MFSSGPIAANLLRGAGNGSGGGWTKVGETSFAVGTTAGTQSYALPAHLTGDIVVVAGASDSALQSIVTSGYSEFYNNSNTAPSLKAFRKIAGGTPDTTIEITRGSATARMQAFVIQIWRGVDATTPIDATPTEVGNATGMPNPPSYNTATDGALVFALGGVDDDDCAASVTAPSGFTNLIAKDTEQASTSVGATVMLASMIKPTAGAIDPDAFGGTGDDQNYGATFALRPA